MDAAGGYPDLLRHLQRLSGQSPAQVARLVEEVIAYFSESVEEFVTRRHAELKREELTNQEIFARIQAELEGRRFAAPALTERQIRRLIYG